MKRTGTGTADDISPFKLLGVMVVTSGSTFATLVTVYQLFFTHSLFA